MAWQNIVGHGLAESAHEIIKPYVHAAATVTNTASPLLSPDVNAIIDATLKGYLRPEACSWACYALGANVDLTQLVVGADYTYPKLVGLASLWQAVFESKQEYPRQGELLEIANRKFWDDPQAQEALKRLGYFAETIRADVANLRYDIPSPSDLVRFSVRHIWEPDILSKLGFDEEFPGGVIDVWHAMKGLDYKLFTGPFKEQIGAFAGAPKVGGSWEEYYALYDVPEPTWARAYWWSHWILPSPGQFFDMLIRLDPQRDRSFDPPEAVGLDFSLADYELGLRANDYPPKYRRALAAINRPIVGIRFLRGLVDNEVYDYDAVIEWARRWGYSPRDQKDIADLVFLQSKGAQQKKAACKGCATCDQAFDVGILNEQDLQGCYVGFGATEQDAERMAQLASLKLRVKRGREIVSNVRKRFLRGTLSGIQARNLLFQWGIQQGRINQYLEDWGLEFEAGRKELSAAQAVKYACQGIITVPDLVIRLTNLGYDLADREALVSEASVCAANLAAQQAAKVARADRQAKADAYTAARRARQSLVEAQRYLASHGTPKQLHDWFCSGEIGEPEVYTRLNALSWPDVDIGRFLSDCKSGRKPTGIFAGGKPVVPPLVPDTPQGEAIEGLP